MPITKRTLETWRKEALNTIANGRPNDDFNYQYNLKLSERILRLTQILLDQYLMTERKR